jgi:hypothetical protein
MSKYLKSINLYKILSRIINKMNDIDKIFQERLSNASVQPPPFVWDGVEKELRKKRRRPIFWWSLGLGTLLGVASLTWFGFSGTTPTNTTTLQKLTANSPSVDTDSTVETAPNVAPLTPNTTEKKTAENQAFNHSLSAKNGSTPPNAMVLPVVSPPAAIPTEGLPVQSPEDKPNSNTQTFTASSSATSPQPIIAGTAVSEVPPSFIFSAGTQRYAILTPLRASITPLKSKMAIVNTKKWQQKIVRKKKEVDTKCYNFESHANAWLFDAYMGSLYAQKSLSVGANPEDKSYYDQRWNSESHRGLGFNAGVRASLLVKQHFSVGTGIDYQQFTENFSYEKPLYIQVLIDPNTGDTLDLDIVTQRFKQYSRFGFVNIPFSAGYEIRQGRRGVHLRGGGAINLLFWKNGTMLDQTTLQPAKFDTQDVFRVNAGLSLIGSAQFFLHIQPRTRLFVEPYYQRILRPVTKGTYPLQQNYNLIGLRLGLTKIF